MEEQVKLLKKQLFWQRVCAWACLGIFLVLLISALLLVPRVNALVGSLETLSQELAAVDWQTLSANLEQVTKTAEESIAALDITGLNQAIKDLQTAISPLVRLFS